ncbi:hypothetical protein D6D08_03154 [Aureobasidium pullulans]|nr:hypothetical protein D6D08_03154 [Aureobasidium pullulans]
MPISDDFVSLEDDLGSISMDDEDFTESNIEDMESEPEPETSITIDYWFGKMYLKCTVAEEVLRDPIGRKSLEAADSMLDTKLQQYLYEGILTTLQAQGIARPDYIIASRRTATSQTEAKPPPQKGMWPGRPALSREQRPTPPTEQDGPPEEMAKYTMALKEHGDCIDAQPSYRNIMISQYPPRFKSVVSFEGTEENGESRTKKDAKHIASRKMCERLGIRFA